MTEIMNAWLQFLLQHGAQIDANELRIADFGRPLQQDDLERGFVSPLTDMGIISASGEDAAHFLHNQVTNDVEHLGPAQARLAGYCSPKGRLLATLLMWKAGDTIMLQLPRQLQAAVQKRLQMFVLRAKVKLNDAADEHVALGLGGLSSVEALAKCFPRLPETPYEKIDGEAGTLIRVADAFNAPRYQWIAPRGIVEQAWPELSSVLLPAGTSAWRLAEIHAGIPQIVPATQEQFVPQMINFELIGGVNFKKGCYPGQEIVARSQYLGKLKRRMMLASIDNAEVKAGMDVFSSADPEQPCGMIVNAERNPLGGADCLVELKTAAMDKGTIHLGSAAGAQLVFQSLPYPLPDASE